MSTKTKNYDLTKPAQTDIYNVDNFNENMDIIDSQLKKAMDTNIMSGATANEDGVQGLVPAPIHGQQSHVLTGGGVFKPLSTLFTAFTGATSSAAGTIGAVPAPLSGDESKFLKGNGSWADLNLSKVSLTFGVLTPSDTDNHTSVFSGKTTIPLPDGYTRDECSYIAYVSLEHLYFNGGTIEKYFNIDQSTGVVTYGRTNSDGDTSWGIKAITYLCIAVK